MSEFSLSKLLSRTFSIRRTLGTRAAAGYLRNREVSLEAALVILGFSVRSW